MLESLGIVVAAVGFLLINGIGIWGYWREDQVKHARIIDAYADPLYSRLYRQTGPLTWCCMFLVLIEIIVLLAGSLWVVFFSW